MQTLPRMQACARAARSALLASLASLAPRAAPAAGTPRRPRSSRTAWRRWSGLLALLACTHAAADWPSAGHDLRNSRRQPAAQGLDSRSAPSLRLRWSIVTDGDVTAHPAADDAFLYFPDSAGWLYKVRKDNGRIAWKRRIAEYTGIEGDWARATPALADGLLVLGNQSGKFLPMFGQPQPQGAWVFAVDAQTGARRWARRIDETPYSIVTQSPVIVGNRVLVGTASNEELVAGLLPPEQFAFRFRGSFQALDLRTGATIWRRFMVPPGYTGGSVWGSTAAVDLRRSQVLVATGNNYSLPPAVLQCLQAGGTPPACIDPDDWFDAVVSMDLGTGAIRWAQRALPVDAWNAGCGLDVPGFVLPPNENCPIPEGPDADFGQGPMLIPLPPDESLAAGEVDADALARDGTRPLLAVVGQKSGQLWAFDAADGTVRWVVQAGPPGLSGGLQWGSSNDGRRVFVAVANSGPTGFGQQPLPWTLKDGTTTLAGGWAAFDVATGATLWTTADPRGSRAEGPVSSTADLVFGCDMLAGAGTLYALHARTGQPLWSFDTGGACYAGATPDDGMLFWGSGTFNGQGPRRVHAFRP